MSDSFIPVTKAPFNMAIASLERISDILREITKLSREFPFLSPDRQSIKVQLIQNLAFNSFPLLKESFEGEILEEILELKPETKGVIKKDGDEYSGVQYQKLSFSYELETKLNKLLVRICRELQKEKYLMPPKEDHGTAITGM